MYKVLCKGRMRAWLPAGVRWGLIVVIVLAVTAGVGCGGPATGESSNVPGVLDQGSTPSLTADTAPTTLPPETSTLEPLLTRLPPISLDELALVQIRSDYLADNRTLYGFPLRVLSPVGDAATVEKLITAYEATRLEPARGFPQLQDVPVYVEFVLKDGSFVSVFVSSKPDEVAVGHWAKGLAEGGAASPYAYASSPELATLARSLAKASSPDSVSNSAFPVEKPQDFGFVLAYGPGGVSVVDTFFGTFTKDLIRNPDAATATVRVELSSEDMAKIFETMAGMGIARYPADYLPSRLPNRDIYYFRLRVGGQEKEIYWGDDRQSTSPDAVALRTLFKQIRAMIEATPEYRSLPPAVGGSS